MKYNEWSGSWGVEEDFANKCVISLSYLRDQIEMNHGDGKEFDTWQWFMVNATTFRPSQQFNGYYMMAHSTSA